MGKISPAEFVRQVKQEANRITWLSRKEVSVSTAVVIVMVVIASAYFSLVDWLVYHIVQLILNVEL